MSPWADAIFSSAKETIPPVKFVLKLFEELTRIPDPLSLAELACTIAYEAAAEEVLASMSGASKKRKTRRVLAVQEPDVDFESFTLNGALSHPFVQRKDRVLSGALELLGFTDDDIERAIIKVHERYVQQLRDLLSNGKTKDKFDPLLRWLSLDSESRAAHAALRRHAEYQTWLFEEARVLNRESYALDRIYVATDCSKLTREQLSTRAKPGCTPINPFYEGIENGDRLPLLLTVLGFIEDKNFNDAIMIQGAPGSGKSSFTLKLVSVLQKRGLRPIRVRLRNVDPSKELCTAINSAIAYEDDDYLAAHERWPAPVDVLLGGNVFREEVTLAGTGARICPYVLILDGWDEISVAVSEGFKEKVKELLLSIRRELLRPNIPKVRVIITGRPSDAVDDCSSFFLSRTPVLTIRVLTPVQLQEMVEKFESTSDRLLSSDFQPALDEYQREFEAYEKLRPAPVPNELLVGVSRFDYVEPLSQSPIAILGFPLLTYLALRLLNLGELNLLDLQADPTNLFRRLTDHIVQNACRPSDSTDERILPRIYGGELRLLLWRTAAEMTALGEEEISREELAARLKLSNLEQALNGLSMGSAITSLMVSFYFKGGNFALGCEFTHKAFREYLFAELIVDTLKAYAGKVNAPLPERAVYWKDFDQTDPRRETIYELVRLLGPQWLTPEIFRYIDGLIKWEISRADNPAPPPGGKVLRWAKVYSACVQ